MLEVDRGSILLDGVDIASVTKESVRDRVAVVPQDNCLFDDTGIYSMQGVKSGSCYSSVV